ncbi:MAG TPA: phosphatase PAP2 family protein, partial [Bacteroidota bacterium]
AFRFKLPTRWLLTSLTALLIIGTVYLRYHYVIDVLGGAVFFLITIWSGWRILAWWERVRSEK